MVTQLDHIRAIAAAVPKRWAFFYGRDSRLLLVCPAADSHLHWPATCIHRLEVRASTPAAD